MTSLPGWLRPSPEGVEAPVSQLSLRPAADWLPTPCGGLSAPTGSLFFSQTNAGGKDGPSCCTLPWPGTANGHRGRGKAKCTKCTGALGAESQVGQSFALTGLPRKCPESPRERRRAGCARGAAQAEWVRGGFSPLLARPIPWAGPRGAAGPVGQRKPVRGRDCSQRLRNTSAPPSPSWGRWCEHLLVRTWARAKAFGPASEAVRAEERAWAVDPAEPHLPHLRPPPWTTCLTAPVQRPVSNVSKADRLLLLGIFCFLQQ